MLTFVPCRACLGVPLLLSFFFPVPFPRLWSEGARSHLRLSCVFDHNPAVY